MYKSNILWFFQYRVGGAFGSGAFDWKLVSLVTVLFISTYSTITFSFFYLRFLSAFEDFFRFYFLAKYDSLHLPQVSTVNILR